MDTNPLPNGDLNSVVSDQQSLIHYVIRITPYDKFSIEELHQFLVDEFQLTKYVLAQETIPQIHYHLVVSTELSIQEVKDILRTFIVPKWEDPVTRRCPRGFGNKQYNIQLSTDVNKALSYALKEATTYYFEGWTTEEIQQFKDLSFTKNSVNNFKTEYQELCTNFQGSNMDEREFMNHYIQLKAKYGQSVRLSDAYGYALSNLFKREPNKIEEHVLNYLYKTI